MNAGKDLIADIEQCRLAPGQLALWWLGQHSFVVKLPSAVLYIDPFLSPLPGRLIPPLLAAGQIRHADFILGSHDHADHIDRAAWPALAAASNHAKFVVPDLLRKRLATELKIPLDRFVGLDDGASYESGRVRITGIAAAHEFLDRDEQTGRYPYLGFVIEADGCVIYHAGDTCLYEGLLGKLKRWSFDVALLPINGRDARRLAGGYIGNMTYQEAADLAGALQPRLTIPTHYDMFAANAEDPSLFADYMKVKYPHLKTHLCAHGRRVVCGQAAESEG